MATRHGSARSCKTRLSQSWPGTGTSHKSVAARGRTESRLHTSRRYGSEPPGPRAPPAASPRGAASAGERLRTLGVPRPRRSAPRGGPARRRCPHPAAPRARRARRRMCGRLRAESPTSDVRVAAAPFARDTYQQRTAAREFTTHRTPDVYCVPLSKVPRSTVLEPRARTRRVGHLKGQRAAMCVPFN